MAEAKPIQQQHYPDIRVDHTQDDILQLWQTGPFEGVVNVTQVEWERVPLLVLALQKAWEKHGRKR